MGLQGRIDKARTTETREQPVVSTWVQRAQQGARIGQPVTDKGLPVRISAGAR